MAELYPVGNRNQRAEALQRKPSGEASAGRSPAGAASAPAKREAVRFEPPNLRELAERLRQSLPGVRVEVAGLSGEDAVRSYAEANRQGLHLVLPSDCLEWMSSSPEAWRQGMEFLAGVLDGLAEEVAQTPGLTGAGAVVGENGTVYQWIAVPAWEDPGKDTETDSLKWMLDSLKDMEKQREKWKKTLLVKKKLAYSAGRDLSRLARVSTVKDVRGLIAKVYAQSTRVRGNSQYNKNEVKAAVAQMEAVVRRARVKVKQLGEEMQIESMRKKAERQRQTEKAAKIRAELKQRQRARRSQEYRQISDPIGSAEPGERRMDGRLDPDEAPLSVAAEPVTVTALESTGGIAAAGTESATPPAGGAEGGGIAVSAGEPG